MLYLLGGGFLSGEEWTVVSMIEAFVANSEGGVPCGFSGGYVIECVALAGDGYTAFS